MMTNDNDTLFTRKMNAIQQNANSEKKKLVKDSVIAKVMASATAGMAVGATAGLAVGATAGMAVGTGAAYAAEHLHKDAENNLVSPEEQAQQNEPTAEESLAELEEKERSREQQEQERQRREEEKEDKEDKPKIKKEDNFLEDHDVKIKGATEETLEDGTTVQIYYGTIDAHPANLFADGNGNVVAAVIDSNDNGNVDENEIIDLRNEHITTQQLNTHQASVPEQEVTVVAVRNDVEVEGETMDMALVSVDGNTGVLIDTDQNGEVNLIAADVNQNGSMDEDEIADVSEAHIPMPSQDDVNGCTTAQMDDGIQDYSNNADTTIYEI